jgi:hypothetical protein
LKVGQALSSGELGEGLGFAGVEVWDARCPFDQSNLSSARIVKNSAQESHNRFARMLHRERMHLPNHCGILDREIST